MTDIYTDLEQALTALEAERGAVQKLREALKAALDALEQIQEEATESEDIVAWCPEVIAQGRAALSLPTQAEPVEGGEVVAWIRKTDITEFTDTEPETDGWKALTYADPTPPASHVPEADFGNTADAMPMLDDDGLAMIVNSHHYTADNIREAIAQLKAFADPQETTQADWDNLDWRGFCNVLWRLMAGLACDLPPASQEQAEPAAQEACNLYEQCEAKIVRRYVVEQRNGGGFCRYCVRATGGTQEIYIGHKNDCERVRQALQTACLDGAFMAEIANREVGYGRA